MDRQKDMQVEEKRRGGRKEKKERKERQKWKQPVSHVKSCKQVKPPHPLAPNVTSSQILALKSRFPTSGGILMLLTNINVLYSHMQQQG